MKSEELVQLIEQPEGLKIDFKRDFYKINDNDYAATMPEQKRKEHRTSQWGEFVKDMLSLANGNVNTAHLTGYLVIGVEDETRLKYDVGYIDVTFLRKQIIQKTTDISNPPLSDVNCEIVEIDGSRLLLITIPPSPHLHETIKDLQTPKRIYPKHTVFVRHGEEVGPANQAERIAISSEKQRYATTSEANVLKQPAALVLSAEKERFSESITAWMDTLKRNVEWLTADQSQVLHQLRYQHRALITGCAGSGKTLLAAEKAIRLDAAGIRTLVLCHNPNLARYLSSLIANPAIDVFDITSFVNKFAGVYSQERGSWNSFDEPLESAIDSAFDALTTLHANYEAIIVDEGQDFRDVWWVLVDTILQYSSNRTLYIFCDDNQALLPHRANYPPDCHQISMSRNCRNAGNIFEIVRRFHREAPILSNFLAKDGIAKISIFETHNFEVRLEEALLDAYSYAEHCQIRMLTNESSAEMSNLNGFEFIRQAQYRWRMVVSEHLRSLREKALSRVTKLRSGNSWSEIANRFNIPLDQRPEDYLAMPSLSQEKIPSPEDICSVKFFASRLLPFFSGERNDTVRFSVYNGGLRLIANAHTGKEIPVNDASKALFYSLNNWSSSILEGQATKVSANRIVDGCDHVLPLYSVNAFKGLECDALVLVIKSASHNLLQELYVGSSRAICYLNLVIARSVYCRLTAFSDIDTKFLSFT